MDAGNMRPTAGVRYALERASAEEPATVYRGFAHLPDRDLVIEVRVEEGRGGASATLEAGSSAAPGLELEKNAAALVKAAVRGAKDAGRALPRRIVRWRG